MSLSNITLTAAVRQNLLSLQGTADLLATTQGRLATGKKVNSALDNPTNFFTAAGLDARASDISNLLDSIGNGVQVLQAANTGITSLSKLVDTAKSIANQVLQQPTGYSSRATSARRRAPVRWPSRYGDRPDQRRHELAARQDADLQDVRDRDDHADHQQRCRCQQCQLGHQPQLGAFGGGYSSEASFNANGSLTFTSDNDAASQTITATGAYAAPPAGSSTSVDVSGTATFGAVTAAVADPVSQATRSSLVSQYNQIITQITTTAQDASFNGINLLNGNSLKLVFDETGKSTSTIPGVTFNPTGLGLAALTAGTDFIDNAATNVVLTALNTASITLRSQASAFGANLSIVQIRQDFNKNIINVLQTGSSALTLADSNEEAANSQALSTRQSIATSALSLANQAQQNVLQLLR